MELLERESLECSANRQVHCSKVRSSEVTSPRMQESRGPVSNYYSRRANYPILILRRTWNPRGGRMATKNESVERNPNS